MFFAITATMNDTGEYRDTYIRMFVFMNNESVLRDAEEIRKRIRNCRNYRI